MKRTLNILVTDDDLHIRSFVCKMIEDTGHTASEAADGHECLNLTKKNHYDAIFLDLIMPAVCGDEVLKSLRNELNYEGTIVICSAEDDDEMMQEYFELGADAYIIKPAQHDVIKGVVNRIAELADTDSSV